MSALVNIAYSDAADLRIPSKSIRFYAIHCDVAAIDRRCLRRYARRAQSAIRRSKSLPKEIKDHFLHRYRWDRLVVRL